MGVRIRGQRLAVGVVAVFLALAILAAVRLPVVTALTKSTAGFGPHPMDPRVRFEEGAEEMATQVAAFLAEAIAIVETQHGISFKKPFEVLICASQESLNAFVGIRPQASIRGMVRLGQVFLAPSAFDWRGEDLHEGSLLHEMSHLHLRQHLGFLAFRGKVPSWFHEGLADLVGQVGGEGITAEAAAAAIFEGRALSPDSTGRLWTLDRVSSNGLGGPMFHRQSRMFVTYIRDQDPAAFRSLLHDLVEQKELARLFRTHLGRGTDEMWEEFVASLREPSGS